MAIVRHSLAQFTVMVTGASRGIGRAIALRAAQDGANVVLTGRSYCEPSHQALEGTLQEVALEVEEAGGIALPLAMDVRCEKQVVRAVNVASSMFGGIDVLVNNASAIDLSGKKNLDLMHEVNTRGTLLCTKACLPHLRQSDVGHVLALSPPVRQLSRRWLAPHFEYTLSKYSMTMCMLAHAGKGVCANTLWPKHVIATAATRMLEEQTGHPVFTKGRSPEYVAEAVHRLLCTDATGQMLLDQDLVPPPSECEAPLDMFVEEEEPPRP